MKNISIFYRLIYIQYVFIKNGLDDVLTQHPRLYLLRFFIYLNPFNWSKKNKKSRGEAIRVSLETLGHIFIKFGQALSTRPDLIPDDIVKELAKLQDNVPPFPGEDVERILKKAYRKPILDVFA